VSISAWFKAAPEALFGRADRSLIAWGTATFADRSLENEYCKYLIEQELPKERFINILGIGMYLFFGALDIITFKENLGAVLFVRWAVCAPLALTIVLLTYRDPFRRFFPHVTAANMAIGSFSIVWMIAMAPPGGPPYIVGILTIFIYFSCITRIYFVVAATVFLTVLTAYAVTITAISPKGAIEVASGLFFMFTIAMISFATSYTQEIRSRLLFHKTRQRELDAAYIKELLIEATAADQSKINFLSVLSHELRTPLHRIIGFCEVVMKQGGDSSSDQSQEFLGQIHQSAHSLLSQIAKMLRYADATAGKIKYHLEDCPVSELVETICAQTNGKAQARGVEIVTDGLKSASLYVDPLNASYAIGHIVENAINASKNGSQVFIRGQKARDGAYLLEIVDRGVGMSPEKIKSALSPFAHMESFRTRTSEGVGLGLALARKILQDQNADISLRSQPDEGTTVTIRFAAPKDTGEDRRAVA